MRVGMIAVAAVSMLFVAACGKDLPPLEFGKAQPSGVKLNVQGVPGQPLPPEKWPDACTLIDDREFKAILPQAGEIRRTPKEITLSSGEWGEIKRTIPTAGCSFRTKLPDERKGSSGHRAVSPSKIYGNSGVSVTILGIGDPGKIREMYDKRRNEKPVSSSTTLTDLRQTHGADACFSTQTAPTATCRLDKYYSELGVGIRVIEIDRDKAAGIVRVQEKAVPEFLRTVTSKMR